MLVESGCGYSCATSPSIIGLPARGHLEDDLCQVEITSASPFVVSSLFTFYDGVFIFHEVPELFISYSFSFKLLLEMFQLLIPGVTVN